MEINHRGCKIGGPFDECVHTDAIVAAIDRLTRAVLTVAMVCAEGSDRISVTEQLAALDKEADRD